MTLHCKKVITKTRTLVKKAEHTDTFLMAGKPFYCQSCPILSNRVHSTKQHSICCRSENCISLERSGQSAVDSIDSFDLSNGKVHYRFDKCGRRSDNCIPILSNRVHPTKQHSICCRSENCISLERSGQSAVDSIDSFDLSNGKVHYRFDKCGRRSDNCISLVTTATRCKIVESIDSFDLSNGKVHYRFDKCGRRSDNCISLATTATRCKIVESIDSFDWWK